MLPLGLFVFFLLIGFRVEAIGLRADYTGKALSGTGIYIRIAGHLRIRDQ
jgi:hypothetical protein